jgi:hypothetical protein
VSRDFRPSVFFINRPPSPQGPTDSQAKAVSHMASNSPRNSIRKSQKSAAEVSMRPRKPTFFCWSSPLTFTFSSNYKYIMSICICYSIPLKELRANIRFHKGSVSQRIPRSHWDCWIRFGGLVDTDRWSRQFQTISSNFSAISKPYAKRL